MLSWNCIFVSLLAATCVGLMGTQALAGERLSDYLRKPAQAVKIGQTPALRVADASGALRWQVPVTPWYCPNKELGGFLYPVGVSPDKPLALKGNLVFVGYGLTREGWDDYQKQRIDGCIAVMYTGTPHLKPTDDRKETTDLLAWTRLIHEKVANAQAHGAVGVWMEFNPLADVDQSIGFYPKKSTGLFGGWVAEQLPLPIFSVGTDTQGVIIDLSSELFKGNITTGGDALSTLLKDAESEAKGLGPLPLALTGDLTWSGAQLTKRVGAHCSLWYQPGSPAARDIDGLVKACDSMLGDLTSLLSAPVQERTTVLLFGDWQSKCFSTKHLGWGEASVGKMSVVYEGRSEDKATLIHELCHVVSLQIGHPPACFIEGLGKLAGDTLGDFKSVQRGRISADDVTAVNLREGKLWTLSQLLALPEIGSESSNSMMAYPEAASFCAFLIRHIGFDGFEKLYRTLNHDDPQDATRELEKVTGNSLDQIETDWHAYLRSTGGQGVSR